MNSRLYRTLALAVPILVGYLPSHAGTTYYVDDTQDTTGNFCTGFQYLQDALEVASSGDIIKVAQGAYRPDQDADSDQTDNDRTEIFQIINGVTLQGGFAGYAGGAPPSTGPLSHAPRPGQPARPPS